MGVSSACKCRCAVFRSGVFIYRGEMRRPGDLLKYLADSIGDSTELPTSRKLVHTTFTVTSLIPICFCKLLLKSFVIALLKMNASRFS